MTKIIRSLSVLLLCIIASSTYAQTSDSASLAGHVTQTSVPFLNMNQDIRSAGIGESGIALPGDNVTHYANPARMTQVEHTSAASLTYTPWMSNLVKNIALYSATAYYKRNEQEVFSAGLRYFKQGKLDMTDNNGQYMASSSPYDLAIDVAYSRKLNKQLSLGAAFRYINSHIATSAYQGYKNGSAVAADLGLYYETAVNEGGQSWHAGAVLRNLGSKIKYGQDLTSYKLPATAGIGVAFQQKIAELHRIIITTEVNEALVKTSGKNSSKGDNIQYNFGAEYMYHSMFAIRAGYSHESPEIGGLRYLTTGVGYTFKTLRFDVAYLVPGGKGATSTISNTFKLGFSFVIK